MKDTFQTITDDKRLLYHYIRGSWCHGIGVEGKSDIDYGGLFMAPKEKLIDLGFNYQGQIADEKNDEVWYELKKFMQLLIKSNPTILEALFVDDKFVKFEHPIITELKKNRNIFLTKKCFPSFFSYAKSQIEKAKGLNKMINWDKNKVQRRGILDFTYTFYNQGSTKIQNWLEYRGLNQKYCGLVNIPNMKDIYGVYYDWGNFFLHEKITLDMLQEIMSNDVLNTNSSDSHMVSFILNFYNLWTDDMRVDDSFVLLKDWFEKQKPIGYSGMVGENSQSLRLSSVSKGEKPICYISYNKDGYIKHCIDYRNYQDWIKHRNPIRYESNLNKSYDAKNMCECFRLMHCGIEIAEGKGYIVDRGGIDADFLLDVKNHKFEYSFLMSKLKDNEEKMKEAINNSNILEDIDPNYVNRLYLNMIDNFFN